MNINFIKKNAMFVSAALFFASSLASAAIVPVFDDGVNDELIIGDGIGIEGFTVAGDSSNGGPSVALRARNRDDANPAQQAGTLYTVDAGLSQVQNPSQPQLQFDFQFTSGNNPADDYWLELQVDFDPSAATDFAVLGLPINFGAPPFQWARIDTNNCINGGSAANCTWGGESADSAYVVANSWNLAFNFWSSLNPSAALYDPSAEGLYDIMLTAFEYDSSNVDLTGLTEPADILAELSQGIGDLVETVTIQAEVVAQQVSAPSMFAILGLSVTGLMFARRK